MKLADWAKKQGISYLTAYRWFRDGKLPIKAYQSDSGTIIVEDEDIKNMPMTNKTEMSHNDIFSIVLKKVVEFSKNNATVEDFAAYILSNFSLKFNSVAESPKYSKNIPKSEDIQRHFQQFIPKGEKPKPNMYVTDDEHFDGLVAEDKHNHPIKIMNSSSCNNSETINNSLYNELLDAFNKKNSCISFSENSDKKTASRLLTQQNYNKSIDSDSDCIFSVGENNEVPTTSLLVDGSVDLSMKNSTEAFTPTKKEIELSKFLSLNETKEDSVPRKRGRKPSKNLGKK